jgi:AraC-like DNA-binding protein
MALPYADRFTFASDDLWLSEFRLPPGHPGWNRVDRTTDGATLVAFPRTAVAIRQERRAEVVADPLSAVLYSPGQAYRRRLISPLGDDCTVLAVSQDLVREVVDEFDSSANAAAFRFPFSAALLERDDHRAIERLRRIVTLAPETDGDAVREELYWILQRVVCNGYRHVQPEVLSTTARAHRDLAQSVREELGRDVASTMSLADLAHAFAVSPFHLVRTFRSTTGRPIHAYRTELRLRSSLPLIADGVRLADVAQQVGFASHAHLTDRFTRAYGISPVKWREASSKSSKNMEAQVRESRTA